MSLYTIVAEQGEHREVLNPEWRMSDMQAGDLAEEYTERYGPLRVYHAIKVEDVEAWLAGGAARTGYPTWKTV